MCCNVADGGDRVPLPGVDESALPRYAERWEIGVLYGPHGAPIFHRSGDHRFLRRRIGSALQLQPHRHPPDRAETPTGPSGRRRGPGLHPSNIHDNAYAVGAVDFTGDMPVILGPDGASLGGFVCPAVVVQAELWKLGQLRPGNSVRFKRLTSESAHALEVAQELFVETPRPARCARSSGG